MQDQPMNITLDQARKVLDTVDAGLCSGSGSHKPGDMCVEAAVCYALGLTRGDNPEKCVAQTPRRNYIILNDACWSSNEARARGMRRGAVAQLGSAGVIDEQRFAKIVTIKTCNIILPERLTGVIDESLVEACRTALTLAEVKRAAWAAERAAGSERAAWAERAAWSAARSAEAAAWSAYTQMADRLIFELKQLESPHA